MKAILIRTSLMVGIFLGIFLIFRYSGIDQLVDFSQIAENRDQILLWVQERYFVSAVIYILGYIAAVALSIPGATVLSISGGFFFGPLIGTVFINIGASIGAFLVFLLSRTLLGKSIQDKYPEKLEKFNREMETNGPNYLLTLRLIPLFPFFLINLFAGVASIKARTFLWTTALGIIPGSFVYAYLGYAGASLEPGGTSFPIEALIALILLGLVSLIPVIIQKRAKAKAQNS